MRVSAIIVTYNRLALLKKNLNCLLSQSYKLNNIFIINNHSTDGTKKYLNNIDKPSIHIINMKKNTGGAGGFNTGIKIAYKYGKFDAFWLMDDDTMPTKNSLSNLVSGATKLKNKFGFLCSNVRWWKNMAPCNVPTLSHKPWSKYASDGLLRVRESTFVSFLVSIKAVKKLGLPLVEAFIWGDDTEYSRRISEYFPSYYVANSIVIHYAKNVDLSCRNIFKDFNDRIPRYKYMYRNRLYVERKHGSFKSLIKWIVRLLIIFIKIPFKSNNEKIKRMFYAIDGIVSGLLFNPDVEKISNENRY